MLSLRYGIAFFSLRIDLLLYNMLKNLSRSMAFHKYFSTFIVEVKR